MTTHGHLERAESFAENLHGRFVERRRLWSFLSLLIDRLLDPPDERWEPEIQRSAELLIRAIGADRCVLFRFGVDGGLVLLADTAAAEGTGSRAFDPASALSWSLPQVFEGETVFLPSLHEDLPLEAEPERGEALARDVKSRLVMPLKAGGEVLGGLWLDDCRGSREWIPELVSQLRMIAGVYGGALRLRDTRARSRREGQLGNLLLAALPDPVLVLDRNGEVLAANHAWTGFPRREVCDDTGRHEAIDYRSPGEPESARDPRAAGPVLDGIRSVVSGHAERFETQYHRPRLGQECHYRLRAIHLPGGGAVVVHTDITELHQVREEHEKKAGEIERLRERLEEGEGFRTVESRSAPGFDEIVGTSAPLMKVLHLVQQVAPTDSAVLILGETGTGKDLIARAIHDAGRRMRRPFLTVNCAALPATLIESELFGYERGAFTGALARTVGRFEAAHGGSILLDEIGELPLEVQAKLLRVLQAGEIERLGSNRTIRVDVRVLAATNRNLQAEVMEGRFRADLFYRLSVFPITVPPLRERSEDIPLLVWHFISREQGRLGKRIERVPEPLMRMLRSHPWPGNVRELRNVIERTMILTSGSSLAVDPLFLRSDAAEARSARGSRLDDVQRAHILEVLEECGWKVAGRGNAAERLGLKRATLQFRMKKLGIRRPAPDT
jgi:transcriptional regulator with GAF, ATPase, and Fis domain